jgi:hypothetical protein
VQGLQFSSRTQPFGQSVQDSQVPELTSDKCSFHAQSIRQVPSTGHVVQKAPSHTGVEVGKLSLDIESTQNW